MFKNLFENLRIKFEKISKDVLFLFVLSSVSTLFLAFVFGFAFYGKYFEAIISLAVFCLFEFAIVFSLSVTDTESYTRMIEHSDKLYNGFSGISTEQTKKIIELEKRLQKLETKFKEKK